ncbi:MAG: hypothetical protein JRI88_05880 [Deltaproteobacteria bacterium]|nr:hypothetical protein [Deltaproteobacteria bacterium]
MTTDEIYGSKELERDYGPLEPLKGKRFGQRSVRLSKAYRAIYIEKQESIIIEVIEVSKHDY